MICQLGGPPPRTSRPPYSPSPGCVANGQVDSCHPNNNLLTRDVCIGRKAQGERTRQSIDLWPMHVLLLVSCASQLQAVGAPPPAAQQLQRQQDAAARHAACLAELNAGLLRCLIRNDAKADRLDFRAGSRRFLKQWYLSPVKCVFLQSNLFIPYSR